MGAFISYGFKFPSDGSEGKNNHGASQENYITQNATNFPKLQLRQLNEIPLFFFTLSFFYISDALCADILTVTVSGYGNTPDDAEECDSKAVRKAIGEFVDAETIAQNGELIKDEVLTYSDGFVESKKILTGPEKDPDLGVFAVTIEAKVVRNKLIERLKESRISVSEVSGDDLWTQAVSKVANVQDGRALLGKFVNEEMLLKDCSWQRLYQKILRGIYCVGIRRAPPNALITIRAPVILAFLSKSSMISNFISKRQYPVFVLYSIRSA